MNITEAQATVCVLRALGAQWHIEHWPEPDAISEALTTLALRAEKALQISIRAEELDAGIRNLVKIAADLEAMA
jgi:hypothetical protein